MKKTIGLAYRFFYLNNNCDFYLLFLAPFSLFNLGVMVASAVISVVYNNQPQLIWFTNFDTFTYQSNTIAAVCVLMYLCKRRCKLFDNNALFLSAAGYLVFTVIFFNLYVLSRVTGFVNVEEHVKGWFSTITSEMPYSFSGNPLTDWISFAQLFLHVIYPASFFGFIWIFFKTYKMREPLHELGKFLLKAGVYPSLYAFYLQTVPFLKIWDNGHDSYSVYGFFSQTKYNSYVWFWSIPIFASMFLILWGLFVINNRYYGAKTKIKSV